MEKTLSRSLAFKYGFFVSLSLGLLLVVGIAEADVTVYSKTKRDATCQETDPAQCPLAGSGYDSVVVTLSINVGATVTNGTISIGAGELESSGDNTLQCSVTDHVATCTGSVRKHFGQATNAMLLALSLGPTMASRRVSKRSLIQTARRRTIPTMGTVGIGVRRPFNT